MNAYPDPRLGWIDGYLAQLRTQRQLSPHTVSAYGRDLQQLASLTQGQDWPAIQSNQIRRLAASLHAQGLDPRSIARKLSSWRGFFDWLGEQQLVSSNPVQSVRPPKRAKSLPRALAIDDAVALVSGSAVHAGSSPEPAQLCNRAMFELLYSSGLRVSELTALDLQAGPGAKGWLLPDSAEVIVTGKGNKQRVVPVGQAALEAVRAWLAVRPAPSDGSNALFLSTRGSRISPRVLQQRLQAQGQAQGLPVHVHPHMLRHSFASHLLQSSGDLRAVQEMLGHSSISSTQVYTALDFQHLAAVYDQTHPRAKVK